MTGLERWSTIDPSGRLVVLDAAAIGHLAERRPRMLHVLDEILATVRRPDRHTADRRPGRARFFRQGLEPHRWLRVVVDFDQDPARIVTAFVDDDPFHRGTA